MTKTTELAEKYAEANYSEYSTDGGWSTESDYEAIKDAYRKGAHDMLERACEWIKEHINIPYEGEFIDDSPVASDYIEWCEKRLEYAKAVADAFKQAMED